MEWVIKIAKVIELGLIAIGGFIAANAAYQMADEKSKGRPSGGEEWWQLVKGGILAAIGATGFISQVLSTITF